MLVEDGQVRDAPVTDALVTDVLVTDVLVIGAGQAGLSTAHHLYRSGIDTMVVDAGDGPGGAWRHRWDTLTMAGVNGIRELPGTAPPQADPREPANRAIPAWFEHYENDQGIDVRRPVRIRRVESLDDGRLRSSGSAPDGREVEFVSRILVNATGTWDAPFWPYYPGRESFAGRQLHTHDYRGPADVRGARVVVIGGGISAVQLAMEIAPVVAAQRWVTRRPPVWLERKFTQEAGRAAVAMVEERVRRGLPPRSVVSVTGLPLTAATRTARESGVLQRFPMFTSIDADGVQWADGSRFDADMLFWNTGFRASLDHLAPLHLRGAGGGIAMDGTRVVADPRIHLVGYGPSASTIGANRAGRAAAREITAFLATEPAAPQAI